MPQQHETTPPTTRWTVTGHPRRVTPVTIALTARATSNLLALATLTAILVDGPTWLAITCTTPTATATALTAGAARHTIRTIPRELQPKAPKDNAWCGSKAAVGQTVCFVTWN